MSTPTAAERASSSPPIPDVITEKCLLHLKKKTLSRGWLSRPARLDLENKPPYHDLSVSNSLMVKKEKQTNHRVKNDGWRLLSGQ